MRNNRKRKGSNSGKNLLEKSGSNSKGATRSASVQNLACKSRRYCPGEDVCVTADKPPFKLAVYAKIKYIEVRIKKDNTKRNT